MLLVEGVEGESNAAIWLPGCGAAMNTESYGAFSQSLHQRYFGERTPREVSIEMTRRCPLECKHCYNNLPMGDLAARNRELSKEEHF